MSYLSRFTCFHMFSTFPRQSVLFSKTAGKTSPRLLNHTVVWLKSNFSIRAAASSSSGGDKGKQDKPGATKGPSAKTSKESSWVDPSKVSLSQEKLKASTAKISKKLDRLGINDLVRSLNVKHHFKEAQQAPNPLLILSPLSLIPLYWAPWKFMTSLEFIPSLEFAQLSYAACILASMAGLHNGMMITKQGSLDVTWDALRPSITSLVLAWLGLLFSPFWGNLCLMTGLTIMCYSAQVSPHYPDWFKSLRLLLTIAAIFALFLTLVCKILPTQKKCKPKSIRKEMKRELKKNI